MPPPVNASLNVPLSRILAGTDFSASGNACVKRAARIAHESDARLEIAHATEPAPTPVWRRLDGMPAVRRAAHAAAVSLMEESVDIAKRFGVTPNTRVVAGAPARVLTDRAAHLRADLLVVGGHGRRTLESVLLGTTAERTLELATCDVLVVREVPRARYRRVLVMVALDPGDAQLVRAALRLAPHASITVVHVCNTPFERKFIRHEVGAPTLRAWQRSFESHAARALDHVIETVRETHPDANITQRLAWGDMPDAIVATAASSGADLIAIGKNTSLVREMFVGSSTRHVVRNSPVDVLVAAPIYTPLVS